jgi:hypothetical protein
LYPSGKEALGLTWFVALHSWENQESEDKYVSAVKARLIPRLPVKGREVIPRWISHLMVPDEPENASESKVDQQGKAYRRLEGIIERAKVRMINPPQ